MNSFKTPKSIIDHIRSNGSVYNLVCVSQCQDWRKSEFARQHGSLRSIFHKGEDRNVETTQNKPILCITSV